MPWRDEILECFTHAPKAGYKAWGVAGPLFWTPGLIRWADVDLINRRAKEAGLDRCTEVYGPPFPIDSAEAQRAANGLALLFNAAEQLGSPLVVIPGWRRTESGLEAIIACIEALLPLIEHKPIRMTLEPHYGTQIQGIEDYDVIFERIKSPQVGVNLDSGHLHSAGVDWKQLIHRHAERIYNFHVKDHIGTQSVPIGTGEVDLKGYVEELHAIDYEGALAVELEVEDLENLPRYCAEAFVYLRDLVKDVTGQLPA
jgi:sugar phosphate isomerase/epimerase